MEIARLNQDQRLMCVIPEQGNSLVTPRESFFECFFLVSRRLMRVMGKHLLLFFCYSSRKSRGTSTKDAASGDAMSLFRGWAGT